jgi:hypothetical protein
VILVNIRNINFNKRLFNNAILHLKVKEEKTIIKDKVNLLTYRLINKYFIENKFISVNLAY